MPLRAPRAVLTIASNKGGVGKTTVVTNLAIYLRALHQDLPVLLIGLDDQNVIDRMFALRASTGPPRNLKHVFAERSLDGTTQMGQFGIEYVPTAPETARLKLRAEDPRTLANILARSEFPGLVIIDTKSDLEALTQNALAAADLAILPVADFASLEEAGKAFELLRRLHGSDARGRVLFTLVDRRTRVDARGRDLHDRLREVASERGWPQFDSSLSRSPRVEAINSATGTPGSVLHHARGTVVHRQLLGLADEVAKLLGLHAGPARVAGDVGARPASAAARESRPPAQPVRVVGGLKGIFLQGLLRRGDR